ncbi:MAG: OmpA family protein [Acidobacteriaceae bacterium]|nr:OmpA family protein [Acidobacteriaceae bacterium]
MKRIAIFATIAIAFLCATINSPAQAISSGEKVKVKGFIVGRSGETFTVKTPDQNKVIVLLTDSTKVQQPRGVFRLRKERMAFTALLPGLKVEVKGVGDDQSRVVADKVKFSGKNLSQAQAIEAGLTPTEEEVKTNSADIKTNTADISSNKQAIAANQQQTAQQGQQLQQHQQEILANQNQIVAVNQRFNDLTEYEVRDSATVYFKTGSATINDQDKATLMQLAQSTANLKGYLIEVKGYCDSRGSAAMNQQLSMERAQEVVALLLQNGNVPLTRIVAPGAMGEADPVATNETKQGRAENRRVEVKILIDKGLAGQTTQAAN